MLDAEQVALREDGGGSGRHCESSLCARSASGKARALNCHRVGPAGVRSQPGANMID